MKLSDYIGLGVFVGFGLWWVLLPNSVVRFYTWFHRGRIRLPRPSLVRLVGGLWIALVLAITIFSAR